VLISSDWVVIEYRSVTRGFQVVELAASIHPEEQREKDSSKENTQR